VGRASNRKKARRQEALRQAAHRTRRARLEPRAGAGPREAPLPRAAALEMVDEVFGPPGEQQTPEYRAWSGGGRPVPAEVPLARCMPEQSRSPSEPSAQCAGPLKQAGAEHHDIITCML
jgi:hypothetical protein